jgi:hypothetical protein
MSRGAISRQGAYSCTDGMPNSHKNSHAQLESAAASSALISHDELRRRRRETIRLLRHDDAPTTAAQQSEPNSGSERSRWGG